MLAFFKGVLIGLFLMLMVGPSFFFLIKVSLQQGFMKAMAFAIGILCSDVVLLVLIYFGLSAIFRNVLFQEIFSLITGLVVFGAGVYSVFAQKKGQRRFNVGEARQWPFYMYLINGFSINVMNPFTFGIWVAVFSKVTDSGYEDTQYLSLFGGVFATIFLVDLLKAWFANRLSRLMTERVLKRINLALGIIFMILGARLLYEGFVLLAGYSESLPTGI